MVCSCWDLCLRGKVNIARQERKSTGPYNSYLLLPMPHHPPSTLDGKWPRKVVPSGAGEMDSGAARQDISQSGWSWAICNGTSEAANEGGQGEDKDGGESLHIKQYRG